MNTDFLLHSNINSLYKSIRDRIQQQINYNIDKKEEKYRNVINKLLIKISKKDRLHIEELNSMALQTICPFLISKIQNKKTPNISYAPNKVMDRMIPQSTLPVKKNKQELESFYDHSGSNIISNDTSNTSEATDGNSAEHFINYNHEQENTIDNNFLNPSQEGFDNYSHSNENTLEGTEIEDQNIIEGFPSETDNNTVEKVDEKPMESAEIKEQNSIEDVTGDRLEKQRDRSERSERIWSDYTKSIDKLQDSNRVKMNEVDELPPPIIDLKTEVENKDNTRIEQILSALESITTEKKKDSTTIKSDYLNQVQTSNNEIKHKTMLVLDIVRNVFPGTDPIFQEGGAPPEKNINDFELFFNDPITIPNNTEVTLEYFSIYKFRGTTRSSLKINKHMETFDSFVVKIKGSGFENIKNYSNTASLGNLATVVVPNDGFGFSDNNEGSGIDNLENQQSYTIKPKSNYVGTIDKSATIHKLTVSLMGTFVDTDEEALTETGPATWTWLHPTGADSRCKVGLMLKPLRS